MRDSTNDPDATSTNDAEEPNDPKTRFDSIRQITPYGAEYWSARDLYTILGYDTWRRFEGAIERAMNICAIAQQEVSTHFFATKKRVAIGSGAKVDIANYHLTRYALHLILSCSDMKKPEIVQALAYITLTSLDTDVDYFAKAKALEIVVPSDIALTKEQKTIGQIMRAFKHIRSIQQYWISPYYIDLYFPDHWIAVECDEEGHRKYPEEAEKKRQSYIEDLLACTFVRYNPDDRNFNICDVINQIMLLVYA